MFYSFYMPVLFNGQTVGKMVTRTKVAKIDGSPDAWSDYMIRWLLRIIDAWTFLGSVGLLFILFTDKRQRVGDLAAETVVISTKYNVTIDHTILEELSEEYEPLFAQVTLLTDKDVRDRKSTRLNSSHVRISYA